MMPQPQGKNRRAVVKSMLATIALGSMAASRAAGKRPHRIGFLSGAGYPELDLAFTDELAKAGLVEGQDVVVVRRIAADVAEAENMARELATSDLELVVPTALPAALRVRAANPGMPMVIGTCPGFVANGFAASMAKPGGIYTGIDELPPGVTERRMRLLKRAAPGIRRLALLSTAPGSAAHEIQLADARRAAQTLGLEVQAFRAKTREEIVAALDAIRTARMDGLQNFQGGLSLANRELIVQFAAAHRLPAIYQARLFVSAGGLMAWAPDQADQLRIAARMVAKILRGTPPGDIPVVHPASYSLLLNVDAARAVGITFDAELLREAESIVGK
jgi:putative ABC transport system substrate-binding protein